MSDPDHIAYFRNRAATERELADAAPAPHIERLHRDIAALYDTLVEQPERRDELKIVIDPWSPDTMH